MSKSFKIYTKTGDDGTTGLLGGSRVKKYDIRLEAYGTIDELNAEIGVIRSFDLSSKLAEYLVDVQNKLFNIGSRLASDEKGKAFTEKLLVTRQHVEFLESVIDEMEEDLPELTHFILPGGDLASAHCHVARTVCRRAERRILEFAEQNQVQPEMIKYINRLSDFLFVLARKLSAISGKQEIAWKQS
ncbi:MAG: cob(I)yrinic acid a,c-diamide adenosyltransferase [Mariniphaga sp.]|nr:cob(I)yrinic acid a,c-diamide adenosyltransferase [Mariniphaga sp.]MDD4224830.1 cob(I)yrinic acid a,c-diamide adenosyltransferase [Mariniphaga sp.]MDD4424976.1 cob(I)yrinic acid a,c-diamide adenosyltransferase [Mariniphaga sp.]